MELGITTEMRNYVSLKEFESNLLIMMILHGYSNFCVPLKMILGFFAGDLYKVILNSKHELIVLLSKDYCPVLKSNIYL